MPRRAGFAILLALLLVIPARAAQDTVVLYPPDLMFTAEDAVKVFAFRPEKGDPDNVAVNWMAGAPLEGELFLKGDAKLNPGMNFLQAAGKTVRLFYLPDARMEQLRLPAGKEGEEMVFQAYRLHPALEDGCEGCHVVEGGRLLQKDQKEACYACHDDFTKAVDGKKVFVHGPVVSGECTGCHDPHFSRRPKLQKLEKGCLECHDAFPDKGTVHRPVARGECTGCHSPHAGPAPKQLVRPGNALCLGCHGMVHTRHRSAEVRGVMTQVPDDFPRDRGDLLCLGCHAPHQSGEASLLRASRQDLCKACHRL